MLASGRRSPEGTIADSQGREPLGHELHRSSPEGTIAGSRGREPLGHEPTTAERHWRRLHRSSPKGTIAGSQGREPLGQWATTKESREAAAEDCRSAGERGACGPVRLESSSCYRSEGISMLTALMKCIFVGLGVGLAGVAMCFPLFHILWGLRESWAAAGVLLDSGGRVALASVRKAIFGARNPWWSDCPRPPLSVRWRVARFGHQVVRRGWRDLRHPFHRMPWGRNRNDDRQSRRSVLRRASVTRKAFVIYNSSV